MVNFSAVSSDNMGLKPCGESATPFFLLPPYEFLQAYIKYGCYKNMGLNSHKSMQILIPIISVGLFSETGVKYGVDSGMLIVHNLLYVECLHNNFLSNISITSQHKIWG